MNAITTVVDCLRHGEVEGGGRFLGITDDPLTANGWRQMAAQCEAGEWELIISSPLRRCYAFAEDLAKRLQLPCHIDPAWSEIDFGAWEGMSAEQIEQAFPGQLAAFYTDPTAITPVHAEGYSDFVSRIHQAWQQTLDRFSGRRLLLVTHGGPIRALLAETLLIPPVNSLQIDIPNACLTRLSCFHNADNRFVQLNFHKPL